MTFKTRRTITISTVFCIALAACGETDDSETDETDGTVESSTSASTSASTDEGTTAQGETDSGSDGGTTAGGSTTDDSGDATTGESTGEETGTAGEDGVGEFLLLGMPEAMDISADGQHVLLFDAFNPAAAGGTGIWHAGEGIEMLDSAGEQGLQYSLGLSDDGGTTVGTMSISGDRYPSRWSGTAWESLGSTGACGPSHGSSWDVSGDGSVVVGLAWGSSCDAYGFRWTAEAGLTALEILGDGSNRGSVISNDGSTVGGFGDAGLFLNRTPAIWGADGTGFFLDDQQIGEVSALSDDGTMAGGTLELDAFYWTQDEGIVNIGRLRDGETDVAMVRDVCAGSEYLIGFSGILPADRDAFIWTRRRGMEKLEDRLVELGLEIPDTVSDVWTVNACSSDGRFLAGAAMGPNGLVAYRVEMPDGWWAL